MSTEIDVKLLREDMGLTQAQFAELLGLDRSSISRMETGQEPKGPTLILLQRLRLETPYRSSIDVPPDRPRHFPKPDAEAGSAETGEDEIEIGDAA